MAQLLDLAFQLADRLFEFEQRLLLLVGLESRHA
jgi:hypothetical protein